MFQKILGFCLLLACITTANAQAGFDTIPPYKKDNHMPAFKIMRLDNSWLTKEQLPKKDYTIIIYFAPDCGHCQHEMKEIIKNIDKFNKVNFVWVSYKSMPEITEFYVKYELSKYPNIFMGRDLDYKLPSFYRVKFTPFVAVYDKKGIFVKAFEGGAEMNELLPVLKLN
jgi:thiol-disulfide isomerase/thioredoxin